MGIAILIMALLVGITNVAMNAWQRSRAEVRASRQAKTMLDAMAKDLECFVMRRGNVNEWLSARTETTLPGSSRDRSTNAAEFIFFSAASDRYRGGAGTAADLGGDVCTVSYKLAYQDPYSDPSKTPNYDNPTFVFYRQLVDPKLTFDRVLGQATFADPSGRSLSKVFDDLNSEVYENQATAVANNADPIYNFMCENVYQYSVTFLINAQSLQNGATVSRSVRVTLGNKADPESNANATFFRLMGNGLLTDVVTPSGLSVTPDEIRAGRLTGVEISITVISDFGINQLKQRTFSSPQAKAQFLAQHSYEFSKTVDLPGM